MRAYGAEVILVPSGKNIGETIAACVSLACRMAAEDSRVFVPQQFENPSNPDVHRRTTAREILDAVDGTIDAFVSGIGTGGTITGVGEVLREANPAVRIVAAEPAEAAILAGGRIGSHIQEGIGDGLIPAILNREVITDLIEVGDAAAVEMCCRLAREEGILAGVSAGTNCWAALEVAKQLGAGSTVVTVLPDTGERYLSTNLFC